MLSPKRTKFRKQQRGRMRGLPHVVTRLLLVSLLYKLKNVAGLLLAR